ncbi:MAG: vWA domain-containing protein [Pseudomonadota bacterium]
MFDIGMSDFGVNTIWPLFLMLLAWLPLFGKSYQVFSHPSISSLPVDALSVYLHRTWSGLGAVAIISTAFAMAGPYWGELNIERLGRGAHVMIVLDRSASMNDDFTDKPTSNDGAVKPDASKMAAARRVLETFIKQSREDLIGMVSFSTSPILVAPLSGDREAVQAALNATEAGGMGFTAVARGLGMGLDYFEGKSMTGSRVILLVSDGAAHLDVKTRELLRNMFQRQQASLYWIYLRSKNGASLSDRPPEGEEQAYPEYELHAYFQTLGMPYQAYEAENPQAVQSAMKTIARLKNKPVYYKQAAPRHDLSNIFYDIALISVLGLLALALMEVKRWRYGSE